MGNNYKTIVYLTTNVKNNKIYIGIHNTENPDKFDGYLGCGVNIYKPSTILHPKTPFQYAVKKYGFDSFVRTTLKVFDSREEALKLEKFLVDESFIIREDTYNVVIGGGDPPKFDKIVYQYDIHGNYIKEHLNILSAQKEIGLKEGISIAITYKTLSGGYLWSFEKTNKLNLKDYKIVTQNKPLYVYSLQGEFIKKYNSISEFCKKNKVTLGPVQRAIIGKTKVRGYYVSDIKLDRFVKEKTKKSTSAVYQYSLDGTFIQEFSSCLEAQRVLGKGYSQIAAKLKLGNPICGEYQWSRTKVSKMQNKIKYDSAKKVGQFDLNGNLIKVFDTVRECRKEFGNVSRVLSGKATKCKGYTFKYI